MLHVILNERADTVTIPVPHMYVGYDDSGEQGCPYSDLDEYLCEYVDGEMDTAVRAVFEEIIRRDPALAVHVEHLQETRAILCDYSHRVGAPCSLHARLHRELSRELAANEHLIDFPASLRLNRVATYASALVLALTIGFYVTDMAFLDAGSDEVRRAAVVQNSPVTRAFRGVPLLTNAPSSLKPVRLSYGPGYASIFSPAHRQSVSASDSQGTFLQTAAFTASAFAP
ncbi:MAG TPA: hypothetical protein VFG50_06545 [Rhodothermales bacterium]|nr:hypothetical protein [Rhodothermales bacterium]